MNDYLAMKLHEAKQQEAARNYREQQYRELAVQSREKLTGVFARAWARWAHPQGMMTVKPTRVTQTLRPCPQAGTINGNLA